MGALFPVIAMVLAILLFGAVGFLATRYRRCPSDKILVIYGRVGNNKSANCLHGGGAFVMPLIQDYAYLSLTPMTISIPLQNALSQQNIRINVPSTFTVGISTDQKIMNNAAERLLHLTPNEIEEMTKEIIFGQLRLTVASLTIEEINQDRERFLAEVRKNAEPELNKIGLYLLNVNITDITDGSNYIESIGKKAASEAINKAKIEVAEQQKIGAIGESSANKEKVVEVAKNTADADMGEKQAEADRRIFVQKQEAMAVIGEAEANSNKTIQVAQKLAEAEMGEKKSEAERRIFVQQREAEAIRGENESKASIAMSNSELLVKEAEARKAAEIAVREAQVEIQKAQYKAEVERLNAEEIVQKEIEKRKIELSAEAEAGKTAIEAKGEAEAVAQRYAAEAEGIKKVLEAKAAGYSNLLKSVNNDAKALATLLMVEKIETIVDKQVEAVKNIKIDKVTVWDSAGGNTDGTSSTSNFVSSLVKSLPPLQDIAGMAGVELPGYLGKVKDDPRVVQPRQVVSTPQPRTQPQAPAQQRPQK